MYMSTIVAKAFAIKLITQVSMICIIGIQRIEKTTYDFRVAT